MGQSNKPLRPAVPETERRSSVRRHLLAGVSLLAMLVGATSAGATLFKYTGAIQDYVVPASGIYDITVAGAQGGNSGFNPNDANSAGVPAFPPGLGGGGAILGGDVYLTGGTTLEIVVGGIGGTLNTALCAPTATQQFTPCGGNLGGPNYGGGGGGGGSFVVVPNLGTVVIQSLGTGSFVVPGTGIVAIAGGGGGGGIGTGIQGDRGSINGGAGGSNGSSGGAGYGKQSGDGGSNGGGGGGGAAKCTSIFGTYICTGRYGGGGGGGYTGFGTSGGSGAGGGQSFAGGLAGGSGGFGLLGLGSTAGMETEISGGAGGFGGGGGGGFDNGTSGYGGGGGGGGFSGGGGGGYSEFLLTKGGAGGGGGGSILAPGFTNVEMLVGANTGYGYVTIDPIFLSAISVPEPGTLGLFASALAGLGLIRRKQRKIG